MFSFYTLGVMSGAAEEVATGAEVTATQQTVHDIIQIMRLLFGFGTRMLRKTEDKHQTC